MERADRERIPRRDLDRRATLEEEKHRFRRGDEGCEMEGREPVAGHCADQGRVGGQQRGAASPVWTAAKAAARRSRSSVMPLMRG